MNESVHPFVAVSSLTFGAARPISLMPSDVVVVVGPNNAGKSATLRGIRDKLRDPASKSPVLHAIKIQRCGSLSELHEWISGWTKPYPQSHPQNPAYVAVGQAIDKAQIDLGWQRTDDAVGELVRWLCHFLSADERLQISNPPQAISISKESPSHPIHYLQRDDKLELRLSSRFRDAFGQDLVVHRNAGNEVPLFVGERPVAGPGEDRVSLSFIKRLEALSTLQSQGDGMRSFAGVLLATSVGHDTILLVDEPEAFLHPPQARLMGSILVQDRGPARQLFIATHSTDVLRGVLDSNSEDVKVIRIRREGATNAVRLLNNARIRELWSDPLLRYSNILDGLFHEGVIACEADSDCRFYSAVLDAAYSLQGNQRKRPDVMFTHCGGKARLPMVIRSLKEVDVPVCAVADFDLLSDEQPLRAIVDALGSDWNSVEADWRIVKAAVDGKRPELNAVEIKRECDRILGGITTGILPEKARSELQTVLRRSTAWSQAKLVGTSFVPSGDASRACERLLRSLRGMGLHVVEVGELEGFVRTEDGHGPKWVNAVLSRQLATDPVLEAARSFTLRIMGSLANGELNAKASER